MNSGNETLIKIKFSAGKLWGRVGYWVFYKKTGRTGSFRSRFPNRYIILSTHFWIIFFHEKARS